MNDKNPEYEKATHRVWFPCLEPHPLDPDKTDPMDEINIDTPHRKPKMAAEAKTVQSGHYAPDS